MSELRATEQATIRGFVVRPRQGLYLALLSDHKGRPRLIERLLSGRDLDPAAVVALPDDERKPDQIAERLRKMGAPDGCHVISADAKIDNREAPLDETLKQVLGSGKATLVSCIAGRLGLFDGGDGDPVLLSTPGGRKQGGRR